MAAHELNATSTQINESAFQQKQERGDREKEVQRTCTMHKTWEWAMIEIHYMILSRPDIRKKYRFFETKKSIH